MEYMCKSESPTLLKALEAKIIILTRVRKVDSRQRLNL